MADSVLDSSMQGVPVFTIAQEGKPHPVKVEQEDVLMFFLDFDDAMELKMELQLEEKATVEVFSLSLLDFLMFTQEAQKDTKIMFKPHRNSLKQLALIAKSKSLEKMPQMMVPLFFARSKETLMSVLHKEKDVVPLFVDPMELQNTLRRNQKEDEMTIDVEFLEGLLSKASERQQIKEQFMLVPSQCQSIRAEMLYKKPPE